GVAGSSPVRSATYFENPVKDWVFCYLAFRKHTELPSFISFISFIPELSCLFRATYSKFFLLLFVISVRSAHAIYE
ncbi:hypothetical protein, partial [Vibrio furnissii]